MTSTPPDPAAGAATISVAVASTVPVTAPSMVNGDESIGHEHHVHHHHHPELTPTDTYQVDSSEFDSGSDAESLPEEEYEALVQEGALGGRGHGPVLPAAAPSDVYTLS